ncbi:MAG: hybrid sensor histidine kinase/response regulator [Spirochaetaceae bacterium]|nr:MAG: hybrid sensor histidine kinase/response regulator [Spirochaetaceae bacterium]
MAEIFVVDDVPQNLQMVMQILSDRGLEVSVAVSGENALEYLTRRKPDLILLDIAMPGMDGFTLCRRIKDNPETSSIPVIFLTAKSETEDVVRGFELGAVDYVRKPFITDELVSRVFTHLELKRSYQRIQEQARQLETLNAQKDRLFSIIAHDMRNPLSGFLSITQLLHSRFRELDQATMEEYLGLLSESSDKLNKLLENLLTWSRLQSEDVQPIIVDIRIGDLLKETADLYRNNAEVKGVGIRISESEEAPVRGDQQMIFTVLRNLVSNAVKYSEKGGLVTIGASRNGAGEVIVTVADTGVGMSAEKVESIFETGATRSRRGTAGESGTGLGLLLSRDLMRLQGGDITAESTPGEGTVFRVILPASAVERDGAASSRP